MKPSTEIVKIFYVIIADGVVGAHPYAIASKQKTPLYTKAERCALAHIKISMSKVAFASLEEYYIYREMRRELEESVNLKTPKP